MNAFFDTRVEMVTYSIQKKGGDGIWETVGQTTVELGDPFVIGGPFQP
jgi:hypothetical protein